MEVKLPVSDKIIWFVLAVCCGGLAINYAYLVQRHWEGVYAIPMWLILIDIALVAGPMKDNKLLSFVILLLTAYFIEYQHMSALKGKDFDAIYFSLLIVLIYGSGLLYFSLLLFGRLDRIAVEHATASADLKGLQEEAQRISKSIEKTAKGEADAPSVSPTSNYSLYRRAVGELFTLRARKDVPGYLVRVLREGFGFDRGVVMELPAQGDATVRELWGEGLSRTGAGMKAFQVPAGLVDMVREKSGAVLESELAGAGPHQEFVEQMHPTGFEPLAMFPLMVRDAGAAAGDERPAWVVMAVRPVGDKPAEFAEDNEGAAEEAKSNLRILPIQSVLDIAGQFVSRANMK